MEVHFLNQPRKFMDLAEQIRQAASIIDIASQYTTLKQRGSKYVGLCPFHSEKTPSFTVDADKQLYHCFGCGAGGDLFTLVMEKEDMTFPEAVRYLAEKYNIPIPDRRRISPHQVKLEEQLHKLCESALAFFRKNLFNTEEGKRALDYLKNRNIPEDIIQELKLGYALNSWDSLLQLFTKQGTSPALLEKAGLILRRQKKEGYYDRFRGRVIFPIFTLSGKVVAFGGRTVFDDDPKYLNSPDTPLYTKGKILYGLNWSKEAIRKEKSSILVEGYTDFIALYRSGYKNCTASLGTSLTSDQVAVLSRFCPNTTICYDGDAAGKKAAGRAISLCLEKRIHARVMQIPEGMDPDTLIQKSGRQGFQSLQDSSEEGLRFLIDNFTQAEKASTPEGKAEASRSLLTNVLSKIADPVAFSEYLKQAAESLGIDEQALRAMIKRKKTARKAAQKQSLLIAEKRLLQICFDDSSIAGQIFSTLSLEHFEDLKSEPVFSSLIDFFRHGKTPDFNALKKNIDPALMKLLSEALIEKREIPSLQEARANLEAIKEFYLRRRRKTLTPQIREAEKSGDKDRLVPLLKQKQAMTKELLNQPSEE